MYTTYLPKESTAGGTYVMISVILIKHVTAEPPRTMHLAAHSIMIFYDALKAQGSRWNSDSRS